MRGHRDLRLATAAAAVCAVLALLLPFEALRLVFAAPLCLVLPGYAITAATFARRGLAWPQKALLSVALSLATLALGSLLLNYTPGGIRPGTWALFLVLVVVALCRAAALRRPKERQRKSMLPRLDVSGPQAGLVAIGVAVATVAVALAFVVLPAKNAIGYTEMWVSTGANAKTAVVRVGVQSQEQHAGSYFLRVQVGDVKRPVVRLFGLRPGESRIVHVRVPAPAKRSPATAALFRQSEPEKIYRRVSAWVPGQESR